MKILYLWPNQLQKDLGGSKIVLEAAQAFEKTGWNTTLYDPWTLPDEQDLSVSWSIRCHRFLQAHSQDYNVVEYDHGHLPFSRKDFAPTTLMVARSGLLGHHFLRIPIPDLYPWRDRLRRLIKGRPAHERYEENCRKAQLTCEQADVINVANDHDKLILQESGISPQKIFVCPFGISEDRRSLFDSISTDVPAVPRIAFVGTFDGRKGGAEFPAIVKGLAELVPDIKLLLLGTKGRLQTKEEVVNYFPGTLRRYIQVLPQYPPDDLPTHLSSCSLGIFPSYIEGFPFGVLEMLAAALPVIAYDAPGAPMMLPDQFLVSRGDVPALVSKVVRLLKAPGELKLAREWARARSLDFSWTTSAEKTELVYVRQFQLLHSIRAVG